MNRTKYLVSYKNGGLIKTTQSRHEALKEAFHCNFATEVTMVHANGEKEDISSEIPENWDEAEERGMA